jgi:hypothetical protein
VVIGQLDGSSWGIRLTDDYTGKSFTTQQPFVGPPTSAEWIVEAPFDSATRTIYALGHYLPDVTFSDALFSGPVTTALPHWFSQGNGITSVPYPLTATGFTVGYGVAPPAAP